MSISGSIVVVSREEISFIIDRVLDRVNIIGIIFWLVLGGIEGGCYI